MSEIVIGKAGQRNVAIDLDVLLETRLLIQANSGGGKSYLLRRLAEQAFGKLPVILIDPEGEFASLREKFGFVLIGEGGETPADPRSAGLVGETLLNLQASAVCDLHEAFRKNPKGRQAWVKAFLEAFIDAPKTLWRDTLLIIDEAQLFCPQDGDSECHNAMVSLNTVGRKRGFCPVWATQRLALIDKDASSQLLNRIIGMTFEDVDADRAVKLLSVAPEEKREFLRSMRTLNPGEFYGFGRAISKERILFRGGEIQTTHPKRGGQRLTGPPPTPEAVKKLLPKLADLPQEAERKIKTEAELRNEVAALKRELAAKAKVEPSEGKASRADISYAVQEVRIAAIWEGYQGGARWAAGEYEKVLRGLRKQVEKALAPLGELTSVPGDIEKAIGRIAAEIERCKAVSPEPRSQPIREIQPALASARTLSLARELTRTFAVQAESNGDLTGPERRILNATAWLQSLGQEAPNQVAVAFLAGYKIGGGAFNNPRGALNSKGLVEYVAGNRIKLTPQGVAAASWPEQSLTAEELQSRVMDRLNGPQQRILRVLLSVYPEAISKEECATRCEPPYALGGAFNNPCGSLRSLGLIEYPSPSQLRAMPLLFLE